MSAGWSSPRISLTRSVWPFSRAARTIWALSGWIFFLRTLVATVLTPAGRGRRGAPRNVPSVEADGEIEKRPANNFRGRPSAAGEGHGLDEDRAGAYVAARVHVTADRRQTRKMILRFAAMVISSTSPRAKTSRHGARPTGISSNCVHCAHSWMGFRTLWSIFDLDHR